MSISREQLRRRIQQQNSITVKQAKAIAIDTAKDILQQAVIDYSVVLAMTLHDELGFGRVRLENFLERVKKQFDCIQEGVVSVEDMKIQLEKETGVVIR